MYGSVRAERGENRRIVVGLACGGGSVRPRLVPLGFRSGGVVHRIVHKQSLHNLFIVSFPRLDGFDAIEVGFHRRINGAHGAVISVPQVGGVIIAIQVKPVIVGFRVHCSHLLQSLSRI